MANLLAAASNCRIAISLAGLRASSTDIVASASPKA
jgi:hypothetical protein